jgi:polar amino acid transport system substrate-binding protein
MIKTLMLLSVLVLSLTSWADDIDHREFNDIIKSGELRVGVAIFTPWVMRAKDGQLVGSEIDMARRLAADMGVKPVIGLYEFEQLIPTLNKGDIDIIVSGMGIKPSRALKVNFSRPYGDAGIGLATNTQMTADFTSVEDLKRPSVKIGVIGDTMSADVAKRLFSKSTIKAYMNQDDMEKALLEGKVHGIIAAQPVPNFLSLQHPQKVDVPLARPLLSFKEGMAINKGDADFLNFLDSWVIARTADAWISSTRHYWLETLKWKEQVQ